MPSWNGVGMIAHLTHTTGPRLNTDASGSWGAGLGLARTGFNLSGTYAPHHCPLQSKSLIPIILAAGLLGRSGRHLSL